LFSLVLLSSSVSLIAVNDRSSEDIADPVEKIFTRIYKENIWESPESISGPGSELRVTQRMSQELSALIKQFGITAIADAPCGDLNWMRYVNMGTCRYIGIDIVQELIERNRRLFGATKEFRHLNLVENVIEPVDLIICRDMLAHLTYEQIFTVLRNFKESGSKYLLVTTGRTVQRNVDMPNTGECRWLNLELAPFNFPKPLLLIEEDVPFSSERGKHLGLWLLEDLNV
jgi:hypothetical protein